MKEGLDAIRAQSQTQGGGQRRGLGSADEPVNMLGHTWQKFLSAIKLPYIPIFSVLNMWVYRMMYSNCLQPLFTNFVLGFYCRVNKLPQTQWLIATLITSSSVG